MNHPGSPTWAQTGCLLCDAPPTVGHHPTCPGASPDTVAYLTEHPTPQIARTWSVAGVRYTGTRARRQAITALMPTMDRYQAGRRHSLPFTVGALLAEIVPALGVAAYLAQFGFHPLATVAVPDCRCTDPWRCRCDFDGHPHHLAHPDLWSQASLLVLRLRRPQGWLDLWLLDLGTHAVVVAEDDITGDPIPTEASRACQMGWCDLCQGTRPAGQVPLPCMHHCHTATQR